MPTHSKARPSASDDHKAKTVKTKNAVATGSRNAITGQKLGKAARRGIIKNAEAVETFLAACESRNMTADLEAATLSLARVIRTTGNGRVSVQTESGEEASLPIAGVIKFRSGAGSKAGSANCMMTGDLIVVRGAQAAARISDGAAKIIAEAYARNGNTVPPGFFKSTAAAEEDDDPYEFDRTVEVAGEKAELAQLRADMARAKALRSGSGSGSALATITEEVDIDAI